MKLRFNRWYVVMLWTIFLIFMITILPQVARAGELAGLEGSIDTNFSFNPSRILDIIIDYGPQGRRYYLIQRWTFDAIYPLVYALPLAFSLWGLLLGSPSIHWAWLPMLAALMDYLENITFSIIILLYPNIGVLGVAMGVILSLIKWIFLSASYGLVLWLLILRFIRFLKHQKKNVVH